MSFERSEQMRMNKAVQAWNQRWENGRFLEQFPDPTAIPQTGSTVYSQNRPANYQ